MKTRKRNTKKGSSVDQIKEKGVQKSQQLQKAKQESPKKKNLPKPKKYLKKDFQQIARIHRSKFQKIFLLKAQRIQEETSQWNFLVQGTSGSQYNLQVSTHVICSCTDFRIKQKPCKHIYFIVTQVAQNEQILDYFNKTKKISKSAYSVLDDQLTERLRKRLSKQQEKEEKDIDLKDDTDCTICFTEMDKVAQTLEGCQICKKYFHMECLSAWKKHNMTCPLCRGALKGATKSNDPLGLLQDVQFTQDQI